MENQVLSIEQMKRLIELGVDTSKATVFWCIVETKGCPPFLMLTNRVFCLELVPALTLQDMISLMPKHIGDYTLNWYISDMIFRYDRIDCCDKFEEIEGLSYSFNENVTILDVAYDMLCNLAEKGYLNKK